MPVMPVQIVALVWKGLNVFECFFFFYLGGSLTSNLVIVYVGLNISYVKHHGS